MKKFYVLLLAMFAGVTGFAQKNSQRHAINKQPAQALHSSARTTAVGDTVVLSNTIGDSLALYTAGPDSGYLAGTNYWGDQSFAERYDFAGTDSTVIVIGALAKFGGKVSTTSSRNLTFNVWSVGDPRYITAGLAYSGFPNTSVVRQDVSLTSLVPGTTQQFLFDSTSGILTGPFFFGYNINYAFTGLNGDTIGLFSSIDGSRSSVPSYLNVTISGTDTLVDTMINVQNATQWSDGTWHDNYTDNDSLFNDLAVYPIVAVWHATGVNSLTHKDLTFYGSFPNPARDCTNIKFSLAGAADVTIQVMDMTGRVVATTTQAQLAAGEHIVPLSTAGIPAGDYIYLIRTSAGDGIASKLTVQK